MDDTRMEQYLERAGGVLGGAALGAAMILGDRLGYYRVLAEGPVSADELAAATRCNPRVTREWADSQAAAGLIDYDADSDRYSVDEVATMVLADENSPVFMARGAQALGSLYLDLDRLELAYRGDGGLPWGEHHHSLFHGTEWFFRPGYRAMLTSQWIPALDGVADRLTAGARVADVGCGHGASLVAMAEAYPSSTFVGIDLHGPSVETAIDRAKEAGVDDRCSFQVADSQGYRGEFDLVCFFDCLHDMGDPVGAARHAKERLAPGGSVLLVEPFALDDRPANIAENPMAAMMYAASSMLCTPCSLSQPVARGIGAAGGEPAMQAVFSEAGFTRLDRVAETPFNIVYQARP